MVVHVVALALWLGSVVGAGLAAAIIFPTVKSLDPALPAYSTYQDDHWMLLAGKVAARIFVATDMIQIAAGGLALLAAGAVLVCGRAPWRRLTTLAWLAALAGATGVLAFQLLVLRPRMDANLHEYWRFAESGQTPQAETAREAFSVEHPLASNLMSATALLTLGALVMSVVATDFRRRGVDASAPAAR